MLNDQLCPDLLSSETACFYTNHRFVISFKVWDYGNSYFTSPQINRDNHQFYFYKPSDLFEMSVDSIITAHSNGYKNLQCSYDLFDECNGKHGLADGCLDASDSFACKYDSEKMKDGFDNFDDDIPIYGSRMPVGHSNFSYVVSGIHSKCFDVSDSPGTYCVNATTYKSYFNENPEISIWDDTPLFHRYPRMTLPEYDYVSWIGIASVSLVVFAVCCSVYQFNEKMKLLAIVCFGKNVLDLISLFTDTEKLFKTYPLVYIYDNFITFIVIAVVLIIYKALFGKFEFFSVMTDQLVKEIASPAKVLAPFLFMKLYHYIVMCFRRVYRPFGYFALGSPMNDLVIYKYNDQILFYITLFLHFITWAIAWKRANSQPAFSRRTAKKSVILAMSYSVICFSLEISFLTRKSKFLDTFHRDPLVVIYSRLDEIILMLYVTGKVIWGMFDENNHFFK